MISFRQQNLGLTEYQQTWQAMQAYTRGRDENSSDELWVVEHHAVFTQGQAGKPEHILAPGEIPVVQTDRGGQVTYHGPGQLVVYVLLDLHRCGIGIRQLVEALENTVIALLHEHGITGLGRRDAPGVYVEEAKVAALGLRVSRGRTYHGLSLNVDMDLEPFTRINPCGFEHQSVTSLANLGIKADIQTLGNRVATLLPLQLARI